VLGTLPYMSPEQLQGLAVDPRTDLFSFGVLLHELATGRRPFRGTSVAALISSILRDPPPPLAEIAPALPDRLQEIIHRCLAKNPEERYPEAAELRRDLAALRRDLAEEETAVTRLASRQGGHAGRRWRRWWGRPALAAGLAVVLLLGLGTFGVLHFRVQAPREVSLETPPADSSAPGPPRVSSPASSSAPVVAVLPFHNLSADQEVDWLRHGLAEMLVTDLAQSPELQVLATGRVERIVSELGPTGAGASPSWELIRELAGRAGADTVLEGSFVRLGDTLRIHVRIRRIASGDLVRGDWVEGRFEQGLFAMVDTLSRTIRRDLEVPRRAELAPSIEEVTTSSFEAWRFFVEGLKLHHQSKDQEAIPLFEQAISLDPDFALALTGLGNLHRNLGHTGLARDYARRAVERAERLPIQQRHAVEGDFYSSQWQTCDRAIDAYRQGLALYPEMSSLRGKLAGRYLFLERYEEAIAEYQEVLDRGNTYAGNYVALASAQAALGRFEVGRSLLEAFVRQHPDDWYAQLGLGWHLTQWGHLAEAVPPLRRAGELRPGDPRVANGWWRLAILAEDFDRAEAAAGEMAAATDPYARWRGLVSAARTELYRGRSAAALAHFEAAARAYPEPGSHTAVGRCWMARLYVQRGEAARALAEARQARQEAPGEWPELEGLFWTALAEQALGHSAAADRWAEELAERAAAHPNVVEERQLHHLRGRLALARGEIERAITELEAAVALLPPRGIPIHDHALPDHVPLWYALGEARLAAGQLSAAAEWFRRVAESGVEHIEHPVLYVRSFHHLGAIYERLGDAPRAAEAQERFRAFWGDGDLASTPRFLPRESPPHAGGAASAPAASGSAPNLQP